MKVSSIGPHIMAEGLDPERTEPPVQTTGVAPVLSSQLETSDKPPESSAQFGSLTNLIEEAKKRLANKKKKPKKLRVLVINAYRELEEFLQRRSDLGRGLDRDA